MSADVREKRVHPLTERVRALRWAAAGLGPLVPLLAGSELGWAYVLLSAAAWAAWGWTLATVGLLLLGPVHRVHVDARGRVSVDGEAVAAWREDPRLAAGIFLGEDELARFVEARPAEPDTAPIERRESLEAETWALESLREDLGLRLVGWAWLLWCAGPALWVAMGETGGLLFAPVSAYFALLALFLAMLLGHLLLELLGLDRTRRELVLTGAELRVDGRALPLAELDFQIVERGGFSTLWVLEGEARWRVAHHRPGAIRALAAQLRARAAQLRGSGEAGEVPAALEAMRRAPGERER